MKPGLQILRSLVVLALLAGCAGQSAPPTSVPTATPIPIQLPATGDVDNGRKLFEVGTPRLQACSTCHSLDGSKLLGPPMQGIASRAGSRVPGQDAETYLLTSMIEPNAYLVDGFAPDVMEPVRVTPQQYRDLITYLLTLE